MNLFLLLFGLFVMPGPVITDAGYCPDVMSAACPVRDYYPRNLRITAVGQDVYYFVDAQPPTHVCFVPLVVYRQYGIGQEAPSTCIWRERLP